MDGHNVIAPSRALTPAEIIYATDVFKDSLDYAKITITRDTLLSWGAPKAIGNTIHLKSTWNHFNGASLELTETGVVTLIHEMAHVWQYQNGGLAYIPKSLWAQLKAALRDGSRSLAYDWQTAHASGVPWEKWNPEQQASAIEDYNVLLRQSKSAQDVQLSIPLTDLSSLQKYMEKVWQREGAPTFRSRAMRKRA